MKTLCALIFILSTYVVSGQKLFKKIDKADSDFLKTYLSGDVKPDDLFANQSGTVEDSTIVYNFSVIEWSAVKNCMPCLIELIENRQKLEKYMNVQDEISKSVVHAASNNNLEMLEFLISKKADVNRVCEPCYGQAPVQVALTYNNYAVFFRLLRAGADLNVENRRKQNLFHTLFYSYDDRRSHQGIPNVPYTKAYDVAKVIVDTLLAYKLNINKEDGYKATPLMSAAMSNQPLLYDYIKSKGGIYNKADIKSVVTLIGFSMYYRVENDITAPNNGMFHKILKEENITLTNELIATPDNGGEYLLTTAVKAQNMDAFVMIMLLHPDVNIIDKDQYRPLNWAIENADAAMAQMLLDEGAEVDSTMLKEAKKVFKANKVLLKKFETVKNN